MSSPTLQDRVEFALARALRAGVGALPDRLAPHAGSALGALVRSPLGIRRRTVEENLRRAFPDADPAWIEARVRETYRHLGREVVSMVRLSRLSHEEVVALTETPPWGELQAALAEGRGALLITGHYGNWEVAAAAVAARGVPIAAVVKSQRNRLVDAMVEDARRRLGVETIDMAKAPRRVPRLLAEGGVVGIVADQDARWKGVWVPFFGIPASTFRGPAQFALRLGSPIFAAVARRLPDGRYRVDAERLRLEPSGDLQADEVRLTAALAAHLESEIRKDPGQYFWFHKRWKTPPPAELRGDESGTNGSAPGSTEGPAEPTDPHQSR